MKQYLGRRLRNALFKLRQITQIDRALILQGQVRAEQILAKGKLQRLSDAGFGVFAQTDEDGIISWLIDRLGIQNKTFVEFGVHDYRESNTRYLATTRAWRGLVIDGSAENVAAMRADELAFMRDIECVASFVTRDNINDLIAQRNFDQRLGILSVDIDGVDYWVLEKISSEADIIVVEYNHFLGDAPVSVPYDAAFSRWGKSAVGSYWGASLSAFRYLLEARGYIFVGTNIIGINAFFVHRDHAASIASWLENSVVHPCVTRDARDAKGRLANTTYAAFADAVAHLPVVRVDTNEIIALGKVCQR